MFPFHRPAGETVKIPTDNDGNLPDYSYYSMTLKERVFYTLIAAVFIYSTAFVFYRSLVFSLLLCPAALVYPRVKTKELIKKRKTELNIQFKDMLYSLSSSLSAGKSMELAFRNVLKDLSILYPDPCTSIVREVGYMIRRLGMNETIEAVLSEFAGRAHIEDVDSFVDVLHTCKRTGGNMIEIIRNTSNVINDKIEIRQEIDTMLAERKFERKVLNVLPILMLILLSVSAGDYMYPVFHTAAGRVVITAAIVLLTAAYFIARKIMEIEV